MLNQGAYPIRPVGRRSRPLPDNTLNPRKDKGRLYLGGQAPYTYTDDEGVVHRVKGVPRRIYGREEQ